MIRSSEAAEAVAASISSKATYTGGGVAVFGGLTSHDMIALAGLLIACLGAFINWYYRHRADRRTEALDKLREEYIRRGRRTDTDLAALGEDD